MEAAAAPARAKGPPYPWLKPAVFAGACLPGALLALDVARGAAGADPVVASIHQLGRLSMVFLLVALACTPARLVLGWTWPARVRRMLGLFAFAYMSAHCIVFDLFVLGGIYLGPYVEAVRERPFILVGSLAALPLYPLVITSTNGMVRRMGYTNWQRLHRLAYLATALAVLHFVMSQKKDVTEPVIYGIVLVVLLAVRVVYRKPAKRRPS